MLILAMIKRIQRIKLTLLMQEITETLYKIRMTAETIHMLQEMKGMPVGKDAVIVISVIGTMLKFLVCQDIRAQGTIEV